MKSEREGISAKMKNGGKMEAKGNNERRENE